MTGPVNFLSLSALIHDKQSSINFLQEHGILPNQRFCDNGHSMILYLSDREDRWRCNDRQCRSQKQLKSGTWFQGAHLSYRDAILFIYCWSHEMTSIKFCQRELLLGAHSVIDWNNYLREVCASVLLANPSVIGGPNTVVEIDESLFCRRKNNVGRVAPKQWVFGGICRETRECFLYAIPDRSAATLTAIITQAILPGTTIMSDMWAAYHDLPDLAGYNYTHLTVNHSENFVNPLTGAHSQTVECMWNLAKSRNRRHFGTHRQMLDSYLCEFMWRQRLNGRNPFDVILENIATYWPPDNH